MTTTEDLRRTLADNASRAPDGLGLIDAARTGAARVRRRNRVVSVGAAAALTACALAAVAVLRPTGGNAPVTADAPASATLTNSVELARDSGWWARLIFSSDGVEIVGARQVGQRPQDGDTTIKVFPANGFDPTELRRGDPITVGGHAAYRRAGAGLGVAAHDEVIGWQDRSGRWVLVLGPRDNATLMSLAAAVRLVALRPVRAPVKLAAVPAGVRYDGVVVISDADGPVGVVLAFYVASLDRPERRGVAYVTVGGPDARLSVADLAWFGVAIRIDDGTPAMDADTGTAITVTGFKTPNNCTVRAYSLDPRGLVEAAGFIRMLNGARYADCTRPATWFDQP